MRPENRRRLDKFFLIISAAAIGLAALLGALGGDTERIGAFWAHAHIDDDGVASVTEVIDYDFGSNRRRGLLRQIPDLPPTTPFTISSPTAPDQFSTQPWWLGTEIRVGDRRETISNRHRYSLAYEHPNLQDPSVQRAACRLERRRRRVAHRRAQRRGAHHRRPRAARLRLRHGGNGAVGGCAVEMVAPGHIVVRHDVVKPGNFLTIRATYGGPVSVTQPIAPSGPAPDPGVGWQSPAVLASLVALGGAFLMSPIIRRTGREVVWEGGSVDAAFGPTTPTLQLDESILPNCGT